MGRCQCSPLCYWFDSCLRSAGKRAGLIRLRFRKLGPNLRPIVGAQVTACYSAACSALDSGTAMDGDRAIASEPIRHVGCIAADLSGKARLGATALRCEVVGKFHGPHFSPGLMESNSLSQIAKK